MANSCSEADYFRKNVRLAIRVRGMTFIDLAEKAEIARPSLSRLMNGRQDATLSYAAKIAEALRVPLARLLESPLEFESWMRTVIAKTFAQV